MSEDKPQDGSAGREPSQGGLWSETEIWRPTGEVYEAPLWPRRIEFGPTASAVSLKRQGRAFQILDRLRQGPARTFELMMLGGAARAMGTSDPLDHGNKDFTIGFWLRRTSNRAAAVDAGRGRIQLQAARIARGWAPDRVRAGGGRGGLPVGVRGVSPMSSAEKVLAEGGGR